MAKKEELTKRRFRQKIPMLGRTLVHDQRSKRYKIKVPKDVEIKSIRHKKVGGVINQLDLGCCTGCAAAHALNHSPYRDAIKDKKSTQKLEDAHEFYSLASYFDPFPGHYPPRDTGSSGLAVGKALKRTGIIHRYLWAFGFEHGLKAVMERPLLQGTIWYEDMSSADEDGRVIPGGARFGGHEYLWVGAKLHVPADDPEAMEKNESWFLNSWGKEWGKNGYFYMTWADHKKLLDQDGDLVAFEMW